jgi:hypothetical protein
VALTAVATVLTSAAPASAGTSCPSSDPVNGPTTGTVTAAESDWYRYTTTGGAIVTMTPTSGDPDLKVMDATCTTTFCYPYTTGVETCALPPGTYNIGVLYYSGPGAVAGYSLTFGPTSQCSDGVDNDSDGAADYPNDPGCGGYDDTSEGVACSASLGLTICAGVNSGTINDEVPVPVVAVRPGTTHSIVGRVDEYLFRLPTGGSVALPCVVLTRDSVSDNACAKAGGTYDSTILELAPVQVTEQWPAIEELTRVTICNGELVATVNGLGIRSLPLLTLCSANLGGGTAH